MPIAAGAPLGWLALRCLGRSGDVSLVRWTLDELHAQRLLYLYLAISTTVVLALIAHRIGALSDRLERDAVTDALTGLYNRRYLEARIVDEIATARRYGTPLSLALIDLDYFKAVNDREGHDVGDALLRRVARVLQAELRGADLLSRPAGDEFVALLPRTSAEDARALSERLRAQVSAQLGGTTLSIGVGELSATHETPRDLFRAADQALYRAKAAGRDAVR